MQVMRSRAWTSCGAMGMDRILVLKTLFSENSATRAIKGKDRMEEHRVGSKSGF